MFAKLKKRIEDEIEGKTRKNCEASFGSDIDCSDTVRKASTTKLSLLPAVNPTFIMDAIEAVECKYESGLFSSNERFADKSTDAQTDFGFSQRNENQVVSHCACGESQLNEAVAILQAQLDEAKKENNLLHMELLKSTKASFQESVCHEKLVQMSRIKELEMDNAALLRKLDSVNQLLSSKQESISSLENALKVAKKAYSDLLTERDDLLIENARIWNSVSSKAAIPNDIEGCNLQTTGQISEKNCDNYEKIEEKFKEYEDNLASLQDDLQTQIKNNKMQQQLINDLKKALQQQVGCSIAQLKGETYPNDSADGKNDNVNPASTLPIGPCIKREVCFKYLKHVILKFIASSYYEAIHIVNAIVVLLDLTRDEEKYLREAISWKTSWWKTKPKFNKLLSAN